jgi:hypothetical protein
VDAETAICAFLGSAYTGLARFCTSIAFLHAIPKDSASYCIYVDVESRISVAFAGKLKVIVSVLEETGLKVSDQNCPQNDGMRGLKIIESSTAYAYSQPLA